MAKSPAVNINFQGGEPLLAGKKYYEKVFDEIKKEALPVSFSIQTNGTLLDKEFSSIFHEFNVLLGISIDGAKEINDKVRGNSFGEVIAGIHVLQEQNVEFNTVTVLAKHNHHEIGEVYNFLKKECCYYQQYITCFPDSYSKNWFLNNAELEYVLNTLFNLWKDDWESIFIREFDDLIKCCLGFPASECALGKYCIGALTLSSDLSLYYCDVAGLKTYAGKYPDEFWNLPKEKKFENFIKHKAELPEPCQECEWINFCQGGCPEMRKDKLYFYCPATKNFINKNIGEIRNIAKQALRRRSESYMEKKNGEQ